MCAASKLGRRGRGRLPDHLRKVPTNIMLTSWVKEAMIEADLLIGPTLEEAVIKHLKLKEPKI